MNVYTRRLVTYTDGEMLCSEARSLVHPGPLVRGMKNNSRAVRAMCRATLPPPPIKPSAYKTRTIPVRSSRSSIFTVQTAPTGEEGTANVDFVIFPERWLVGEHTFRPPWYHVNIMSEFMGLIYGRYDAKEQGFVPGGVSLHNCMLPHGPDNDAFQKGSFTELKPIKHENTMAFMFETRFPQQLTEFAASVPSRQPDYPSCWNTLQRNFDPSRRNWSGRA